MKRNEARIIIGKTAAKPSGRFQNVSAPLRFTVIIPAEGGVAGLRDCLDSFLAQTHREWECICVDDCTLDATETILGEYARLDARFRIIRRERKGGVFAAMNSGLRAARGDYITFARVGDILPPRSLEIAGLVAENSGAGIVRLKSSSANGFAMSAVHAMFETFAARELFENFALRGDPVANTFYRRASIDGLRFAEDVGPLSADLFGLESLVRTSRFAQSAVGGIRRKRADCRQTATVGDVIRFIEELGRWYAASVRMLSLCGALPVVKERLLARVNSLVMAIFKSNVERASSARIVA